LYRVELRPLVRWRHLIYVKLRVDVKLRALTIFLVAAAAAPAQSSFSVVSAANYQPAIAPDSIASIFGTNLARATAIASLDSAGQLPTELAATRVEVNGQTAALFYVSPSQINFVVPAGIVPGTTTVVLRATVTNATRSASVQTAPTVPAAFSSDASGRGPGAILNAVTFTRAPFVVQTDNGLANNLDTRTRLAAYGTGFRHAKNAGARATDSKGNRYDLTVEYAGAAPGFFGLDQLNFIVPAELDGTGAVSLEILTEDGTSNVVTFQMSLLAANLIRLAGITLSPQVVSAGQSMTATVSLNGVARAGGFPVALRSTNPAAQPTSLFTIPEGKAFAQMSVNTTSVASVQTGSILADAMGLTRSADFEIDPANQVDLSGISVSPGSILGGRNVSGLVNLTARAPAGGINVQLASDNSSVRPPATVNVPFNQSSATFTIGTAAVTSEVNATVTATLGRTTSTAKVKLLPPMTLSLDAATVTGGSMVNGVVTLGDPAPVTGAIILLSSSDGTIARPPGAITISSGLTTGDFTITTTAVNSARTATISASYQGLMQSVSLSVAPPSAETLSALTISLAHVTGGTSAQGSITLTAPAGFGGLRVGLESSSLLVAQVPGFVIVPQGSTNFQFSIPTTRVVSPQAVTITASVGGVSKSAVLTVQ